jgi:hypothetical protein
MLHMHLSNNIEVTLWQVFFLNGSPPHMRCDGHLCYMRPTVHWDDEDEAEGKSLVEMDPAQKVVRLGQK